MKEIWKPVFGWNDIYEVSNLGNVKRVAESNKSVGLLKTQKSQKYLRVKLHYKGKQETRSVHSLVLEAFVCPRPDGLVCNHKDGNKHNNLLNNLEWVTPSENTQHGFDVLKRNTPRGENHGMAKLNLEQVNQIRAMYKTGKYGQHGLAKIFNVGRRAIQGVVSGSTWRNSE